MFTNLYFRECDSYTNANNETITSAKKVPIACNVVTDVLLLGLFAGGVAAIIYALLSLPPGLNSITHMPTVNSVILGVGGGAVGSVIMANFVRYIISLCIMKSKKTKREERAIPHIKNKQKAEKKLETVNALLAERSETNKYAVFCTLQGKHYVQGYFPTEESAKKARDFLNDHGLEQYMVTSSPFHQTDPQNIIIGNQLEDHRKLYEKKVLAESEQSEAILSGKDKTIWLRGIQEKQEEARRLRGNL